MFAANLLNKLSSKYWDNVQRLRNGADSNFDDDNYYDTTWGWYWLLLDQNEIVLKLARSHNTATSKYNYTHNLGLEINSSRIFFLFVKISKWLYDHFINQKNKLTTHSHVRAPAFQLSLKRSFFKVPNFYNSETTKKGKQRHSPQGDFFFRFMNKIKKFCRVREITQRTPLKTL